MKETTIIGMGQDAGKSIAAGTSNLLDKLKTPVFWFAVGYITALIVLRKKRVVSL